MPENYLDAFSGKLENYDLSQLVEYGKEKHTRRSADVLSVLGMLAGKSRLATSNVRVYVDITVPGDLQQEMSSIQAAGVEILRHFWSAVQNSDLDVDFSITRCAKSRYIQLLQSRQ